MAGLTGASTKGGNRSLGGTAARPQTQLPTVDRTPHSADGVRLLPGHQAPSAQYSVAPLRTHPAHVQIERQPDTGRACPLKDEHRHVTRAALMLPPVNIEPRTTQFLTRHSDRPCRPHALHLLGLGLLACLLNLFLGDGGENKKDEGISCKRACPPPAACRTRYLLGWPPAVIGGVFHGRHPQSLV